MSDFAGLATLASGEPRQQVAELMEKVQAVLDPAPSDLHGSALINLLGLYVAFGVRPEQQLRMVKSMPAMLLAVLESAWKEHPDRCPAQVQQVAGRG